VSTKLIDPSKFVYVEPSALITKEQELSQQLKVLFEYVRPVNSFLDSEVQIQRMDSDGKGGTFLTIEVQGKKPASFFIGMQGPALLYWLYQNVDLSRLFLVQVAVIKDFEWGEKLFEYATLMQLDPFHFVASSGSVQIVSPWYMMDVNVRMARRDHTQITYLPTPDYGHLRIMLKAIEEFMDVKRLHQPNLVSSAFIRLPNEMALKFFKDNEAMFNLWEEIYPELGLFVRQKLESVCY
jgi:hypothetical protein